MAGEPPIKVVVCGALGRMGKEVVAAACADPEIDLVGGIDIRATEEYLSLPEGAGLIPLSRDAEHILGRTRPRVLVDFTHPEAVMGNVRAAFRHGVSPVVGTTGVTAENLEEIGRLCKEHGVGAVVAPNFAIGANLMMHFARVASTYFPSAEIIELHHDQKADAPSGTALSTAQTMVESRGSDFVPAATSKFTLEGTRGGVTRGIHIHSVRLPGLVAHQEVIFGGKGQTLTVRHDSYGRESFLPGVLMAVKEVVKRNELVYGLDRIMGLR